MDDLIAFIRARLDEDEHAVGDREEPRDWYDRASGVHLECDRARREIAAKRDIVNAYESAATADRYGSFPAPIDHYQDGVEFALRSIGVIYRDHPDYRAAWAPRLLLLALGLAALGCPG